MSLLIALIIAAGLLMAAAKVFAAGKHPHPACCQATKQQIVEEASEVPFPEAAKRSNPEDTNV